MANVYSTLNPLDPKLFTKIDEMKTENNSKMHLTRE